MYTGKNNKRSRKISSPRQNSIHISFLNGNHAKNVMIKSKALCRQKNWVSWLKNIFTKNSLIMLWVLQNSVTCIQPAAFYILGVFFANILTIYKKKKKHTNPNVNEITYKQKYISFWPIDLILIFIFNG